MHFWKLISIANLPTSPKQRPKRHKRTQRTSLTPSISLQEKHPELQIELFHKGRKANPVASGGSAFHQRDGELSIVWKAKKNKSWAQKLWGKAWCMCMCWLWLCKQSGRLWTWKLDHPHVCRCGNVLHVYCIVDVLHTIFDKKHGDEHHLRTGIWWKGFIIRQEYCLYRHNMSQQGISSESPCYDRYQRIWRTPMIRRWRGPKWLNKISWLAFDGSKCRHHLGFEKKTTSNVNCCFFLRLPKNLGLRPTYSEKWHFQLSAFLVDLSKLKVNTHDFTKIARGFSLLNYFLGWYCVDIATNHIDPTHPLWRKHTPAKTATSRP